MTTTCWRPARSWENRTFGGLVVTWKNGRLNIVLGEPRDHYRGYFWTFPKGGLSHRLESPLEAAIREVCEETGFLCTAVDRLPGTFSTGASVRTSNFYVMVPSFHEPIFMDGEMHDVRSVRADQAARFIRKTTNPDGRERDLRILQTALRHITPACLLAGPEPVTGSRRMERLYGARLKSILCSGRGPRRGVSMEDGRSEPPDGKARKRRIRAAIDSMTTQELLQVGLAARGYSQKMPGAVSADDLMQEAIAQALSGRWKWPERVPFHVFLIMTMKAVHEQ